MNRIDKPLVIEGSAETNNQLVRIIRKKLRAKQLPFVRITQWHWHGQFMGPKYKQTCREKKQRMCKLTILSDQTKHSNSATSPIKKMVPG